VVLEQPWASQYGPAAPKASGQDRSESADGGNRRNGTFLGIRHAQSFLAKPASPGRACHSRRTQLHSVLMVLGPASSTKGSHVQSSVFTHM